MMGCINKIRMAQSLNKHYRFQLPQMSMAPKPKKQSKMINETTDIYLQNGPKNRYSVNYAPLRSRNNYDTLKTINRKSIEINTSKNATIQAPQRTYYKRGNQPFKKNSQQRRYDEEDVRSSNKSPYLKRQFQQGRTSSLNRSTHKIRSSNHMARNLNAQGQLYKQPRSSLSQHYDPNESSMHKRRVSVNNNDRNYVLEEAKQYYKNNEFQKSIEILRKYSKYNRNSAEARYFLGMSFINNNQFSLGIQQLLETLNLDPKYKKSLYLVIALAFKRLNKIDQAIQILTKGLQNFPEYYDCLVYRGKMYLKGNNYECAIKDFAKAIKFNPKKGFAYLGKGTAEKQLLMYPEAIESFSQGINTDLVDACLEKRGICYYQTSYYEQALKDFERCKDGGGGSSLHYMKGLTYYRMKRPIEAILSFQQSLKHDSNPENVTSSVEMMMRIKVEDKDFYQAYHILNRTNNIEINKEIIEEWKLFIEGTLFMMKKKYKQGITTYKSLLSMPLYSSRYDQIKNKKEKERFCFIKPLVHLYKAFGELSEGNQEAAKEDYAFYDSLNRKIGIKEINLSKRFNSLIIQAQEKFPNDCLSQLEEASQLIPNKPEPYLFLAFERVQNRLDKSLQNKQQDLEFIINSLSIGISHLPQLSNNHISSFYYYRSIIYLFKGDFNKAVSDVDKAIEKSEDNIPKYFHLRGLIFAMFGNFSQSVQDLSVAISLDDKYAKPYLERAKCLQIQGNSNEAFLDLQKYITLAPEDPFIHKYAGFLLFQNCAYEDCLAAFSHGNEDLIDYEMILTKAKCNFLLNNTLECLKLFNKYQQETMSLQFKNDIQLIQISSQKITPSSTAQSHKKTLKDITKIIQSIKNEQDQCKIFKLRDMHQIKASIYLLLGDYDKSMEQFDKTLHFFRQEKKRQMEKQFIEDQQEFQDEWSEVQIKFNLSLCYIAMKMYDKALTIVQEFHKSSQRGKNWDQFIELLLDLRQGKIPVTKRIQIDTFEQNHRISKNWPKFQIPGYQIYLSMAFSYPFVEPPEMLPEFDDSLFHEFHMNKIENKPEAPWINRQQKCLVFTPNIQVFQNLELSVTTKQMNGNDGEDSEKNKPISDIDHSVELSNSDFQLETQALKQKFKLDSLVEMRLKKLMNKNG